MGPGGVSKPGMKPIQAPLVPLLAVISLPALTSSVSAVAFPESPIVLACVSLSLVYTIVVALGLCYYLQNKAGKMQEGVYFPAISQLGIEAPEQLLYQVGMTLVSTCMVVGVMRMEDTLLPHYFFEKNYTEIVDTQEAFMACRKAGFIAAAGVCIQGIFTLEIKLSTRSFMHWGGTAVFAYGAFNHCDGVMRLLDGVRSPLQDVPAVALSKQVKHVFLEQVPSMLFFLPILGQVLSAAGIGKKEDDAAALTKKDDDAVELKDTRTAQEVREQLPEKAQARLAAYEAKLTEWKISKLASFDEESSVVREKFRRRLEKTDPATAQGEDGAALRDAFHLHISRIAARNHAEALFKLNKEAQAKAKEEEQTMSPMVANSMGLMQWIMIGMFVAFFGTYAVDLYFAKAIKV